MGDAHTNAPEAHGESTSLDDGDGSRLYKPLLQPALLVYASLKLALGFTHTGLLSHTPSLTFLPQPVSKASGRCCA